MVRALASASLGMKLKDTAIVIVENGVRLRLNIVDTPGYGDQINNEGWCVHDASGRD